MRSPNRLGILAGLLAASMLMGCTNALYFYETTKLSMTVEGRPDSTQPVSGSIAAKARTAVVVPPRKDGEAGSMISLFRTSKASGFLGKVTMTSMLVTGDAAVEAANQNKAAEVAGAMVAQSIPDENAILCADLREALTALGAPAVQALAARDWATLTPDEQQSLREATGRGPRYDSPFHLRVRAALAAGTCD